MGSIVVVGSSNTDMVVKTPRFPSPGETILGGDFFMFPGGKGANQAVAAARLGGDVKFICCVGDDLFGKNAIEGYLKEGLDVDGIKVAEKVPSGVALITVNQEGENEIVVASGANNELTTAHIEKKSGIFQNAEIVLTQLETPISVVEKMADYCNSHAKNLILNPAPATTIPDGIMSGLFLITPNQTESEILTGIAVNDEASAAKAGEGFLAKGVRNIIITMGSKGAFFMNENEAFFIEASKVKAVDTTAAGDVFNGALAVFLSQKVPWKEAISKANKAAGIAVTKMGAQASAPFLHEIN